MNVVNLEQYEIDTRIDGLFLSTQQRRFIQCVAINPHSLTVAINKATAIDNISNRFGEPSQMYERAMFKLPQRVVNGSFNASALEVSQ
jgi:hypothetical protein